MSVQKEVWVAHIIGNLFKDNEFLNFAFDESEYVLQGTVVHIPGAGAPSGATRNRTNLPATVTIRQDVDVLYPLDNYTSNPRLIKNAEQVECSYNKRESVLSEDLAAIKEQMAEWMLYKWLQNCQILRTTGGASVTAHVGTGNRKALLAAHLKKARTLMNKMNIPKENRYCLIDSDMYEQLTADATFNSTPDAIRDLNLPEGTIQKLHGFWLMERSTVAVATNASTPVIKTPDAAAAATDNAVAICWQKDEVAKAIGNVDFFENQRDATYYGDIYSSEVRFGGRSRRQNPGVVAIIQEVA